MKSRSSADSPERRWWPDALAAIGVVLGATIICVGGLMRRPDLYASEDFLFSDPGVNLLLAEKLANGALLYRDAGFSYGPLAIYPYTWFSRLFGNTAQTYTAFLAVLSVAGVLLAYLVMRRAVSRTAAVVVVVGGLYATLLIPGSLTYGAQGSSYVGLERLLFLGVLLVWRPPLDRRWKDAILLGGLLGTWQGVRFGTAFFVGAAIVLVDVLALILGGSDRRALERWLRVSLGTLGAFGAVQSAWVIWAFAVLPSPDARDFLWPAYVLEAFATWNRAHRWPHFESIELFVGQQLLPFGSAILGALALYRILAAHKHTEPSARAVVMRTSNAPALVLLIPLCFYAIGAAGLFRGVGHFHQYMWALPLTAALMLDRGGRRALASFLVVALPGTALVLRANLVTRPGPDLALLRTADGGSLVVTPEEKARAVAIHEYATQPVRRALIIVPVGAGFHALYDIPSPRRQSFYILGFARGDDATAMLRTLASEPSAMVLTNLPSGDRPAADPCSWYGRPHFSRDTCRALAERLNIAGAMRVDEMTWVVPSRFAGDPD